MQIVFFDPALQIHGEQCACQQNLKKIFLGNILISKDAENVYSIVFLILYII